jgi:hypothetical protein
MGRVLGLVVIGLPLIIIANLIAQRVLPTVTSDGLGRRVSYRIVTRVIAAGVAIIVIAVAAAFNQ